MNYRIVIQPPAETDLEQAFLWITEASPESAAKWYNGCIDAIRSLSKLPRRCSLAPENEAFGCEIRQLLFGRYRILFTIRGKAVHILHVRHGARRHLTPEGDSIETDE